MGNDYTATTQGVKVSVRSFFLADKSNPDEGEFFWAYRIRIENQGDDAVQVLKRTWHITDAQGRTQSVHGDGVVGETPVIDPGKMFEYTSGTPLNTPSGFMGGMYHAVVVPTGEKLDLTIPTFSLDSPHQDHRVH
ncbi:MAG: Co2+/Mg2+ efflux protein ApaG [Acetobacteraceae bacterium]|nr:Co2+/Mg2+ efflux protein ApaG [Acetobacteraceae bacterium]